MVEQLRAAGHQVVVIDKAVAPHREDVEFFDVDIVDYEGLRDATVGCDYLFHLAAVSNVNHAFDDPLRCVAVNIQGTANALEAGRQNKVGRFVLASTVWVYTGAPGQDVTEESPFYLSGAGHIYTSSKIADEMLCHDYHNLYGVAFTILRYGIPYGPRMREGLVIPIFIKKALAGEPITITGDGGQYRNFVYVEDLARAHLLIMNGKAENETYNLEGTRKVTIRDIAETIRKLLGGHAEIQYLPARPGDYAGKEVSAEKARVELGWQPVVDFGEGMRNTVAWFRGRLSVPQE